MRSVGCAPFDSAVYQAKCGEAEFLPNSLRSFAFGLHLHVLYEAVRPHVRIGACSHIAFIAECSDLHVVISWVTFNDLQGVSSGLPPARRFSFLL